MFGCFLGLRLFVDETASGLGHPILVQVFLGRGEVAVRAWSFLLPGLTCRQLIRGFASEQVEQLLTSKEIGKLKMAQGEDAAVRASLAALVESTAGAVSGDVAGVKTELLRVFAVAGALVKPVALTKLVDKLAERDESAPVVLKAKKPVADSTLSNTENVLWGEDIHEYLEREVKPFVPDAWIDESKTKEGAEIPFTRHFYEYVPPRSLEEIDRNLNEVLGRIKKRLEEVIG